MHVWCINARKGYSPFETTCCGSAGCMGIPPCKRLAKFATIDVVFVLQPGLGTVLSSGGKARPVKGLRS